MFKNRCKLIEICLKLTKKPLKWSRNGKTWPKKRSKMIKNSKNVHDSFAKIGLKRPNIEIVPYSVEK